MKISGFSYVRNGFDYSCPFVEAIRSILPICDEFVIAVGNSTDGTREAIENIQSPKIKIIDTVWDMSLNEGGKIFAQQSNIALDHISGDWAFHIQADEVMHESGLPLIMDVINKYQNDKNIDGFIFPFLHFWGDYFHVRNSRRVHRFEVRLFKNDKLVRSYKDSQGFRKYKSLEEYEQLQESGKKLNVKKIDTPVYHYNGVRSKQAMAKKSNNFQAFYGREVLIDKPPQNFNNDFELSTIDRVTEFKGEHPAIMKSQIELSNFKFVHDTSKSVWHKHDKFFQPIEDALGFKFGEYKNYKIV